MANNTQFQPGHKLSHGRPKGSKNKVSFDLFEAIDKVASEKQISLYEHFVRKAYENDLVLIALMKKLLPNPKNEEDRSNLSQQVLDLLNSPAKSGDRSGVTVA